MASADVILAHHVLKYHSSVKLNFGGTCASLKVCRLSPAVMSPVSLFTNMTPDCKPIPIKSRRYSQQDYKFIENKT